VKVYIAGPMTGLPDFNYPTFFKAAERLREAGYEPLNPAREAGREGCTDWLAFMRAGLRDLADADGVATLPGYEQSRGAWIEVRLARDLGFPVRTVDEWMER
jgi:hypothetical protein